MLRSHREEVHLTLLENSHIMQSVYKRIFGYKR